jgi:hypothetical protein
MINKEIILFARSADSEKRQIVKDRSASRLAEIDNRSIAKADSACKSAVSNMKMTVPVGPLK